MLLYPFVAEYINSRRSHQEVDSYENTVKTLTADDTKQMMEAAQAYNQSLAALEYPLSEHEKVSGYDDLLNPDKTGMIGFISIDKIQVELPIYHGTDNYVLSFAAGHVKGSSLPIGGKGTHSIISAHRGLPSARLFTDLNRMELGDIFQITVLDETFTYKVDQIKTVLPEDVNDLAIDEDEDYCTLLTCTPYGVNTHRLLVRGTRIEIKTPLKVQITSEAYLINKVIVVVAVAVPIIVGLVVFILMKPTKKKIRFE